MNLADILTAFGGALIVVMSLGLLFVAASTLSLATYAWWNPRQGTRTCFPATPSGNVLSFSLIVPCRHEEEGVMRATLQRLLDQSHPDIEVILSVGDDDLETCAIAWSLADEHPGRVEVSVNTDPVKSKPRQLNTALAMCTKEIVGIFDAESIAAPDLLHRIDGCFQVHDADVVQGAVQLINYRDSWYSLRNCLEYFVWFRSRLHAQSTLGFIPLGGNTVFVRRHLLEAIGGWDGDCLAEDCDLGVRLSTLRRRIVVAYAPELVTKEESPGSVAALVRQRTRWALGYMQVYAKGDWRNLPRFQDRAIAWWTLVQQHALALTGALIPLAIAFAIWGKFPIPIALFSFVPLIALIAMTVFEVCMLREFGHDHGFRIRPSDYARLVIGTPAYQLLLAFSTLRALVRFHRHDFRWEKTPHGGRHLSYLGAQ